MDENRAPAAEIAGVDLERDLFMRTLLRELSGVLQDVVGLEDAKGFVSIVGNTMGAQLDEAYRSALQVENLDREQLANVLVDLKHKIQGGFFIVEQTEDKIVFGNTRCPFGDKVIGRPSLCMMTSNVFGRIAADNQGYAEVDIEQAIARGDPGCRVTVYLRPSDEVHETARSYYRQ